jgi:hypothetical protein
LEGYLDHVVEVVDDDLGGADEVGDCAGFVLDGGLLAVSVGEVNIV